MNKFYQLFLINQLDYTEDCTNCNTVKGEYYEPTERN